MKVPEGETQLSGPHVPTVTVCMNILGFTRVIVYGARIAIDPSTAWRFRRCRRWSPARMRIIAAGASSPWDL